ncbi:MAG: glycosyltransferase [Candidatus Sumerlaeia bacterium]|nr:glycosyltransferase [Candidatus Sumerlaeia bacterium]
MARILTLIGAHLCMAPRPLKEAEALASAGHDVTIAGVWFDGELAARDAELARDRPWRFVPVADFRPVDARRRLTGMRLRARRRLALLGWRMLHRASPHLFGYAAREMRGLVRRERPDLTIAHCESALWAATRARAEGLRVGVDFEDWFSRDLLPEARRDRPVGTLEAWEGTLARACTYCLAPSRSMANALARTFDAPSPAVVRNVFPFGERDSIDGEHRDRRDESLPSVHWYSQTIGPGRGLELLVDALPLLNHPLQVHLRGRVQAGFREWIAARAGPRWAENVHVHDVVPPGELLSRIAEHDIGLALESPDIASRDLTITNKLFQYMQAGLAIVATRTTGQTEALAGAPGAGIVLDRHEPEALAVALDALAGSPPRLAAMRKASLAAARTTFNWEREAAVVIDRAEKALGQP